MDSHSHWRASNNTRINIMQHICVLTKWGAQTEIWKVNSSWENEFVLSKLMMLLSHVWGCDICTRTIWLRAGMRVVLWIGKMYMLSSSKRFCVPWVGKVQKLFCMGNWLAMFGKYGRVLDMATLPQILYEEHEGSLYKATVL